MAVDFPIPFLPSTPTTFPKIGVGKENNSKRFLPYL